MKAGPVRFYTGSPDVENSPERHFFWTRKLAAMGRQGVVAYSKPLQYRGGRGSV